MKPEIHIIRHIKKMLDAVEPYTKEGRYPEAIKLLTVARELIEVLEKRR